MDEWELIEWERQQEANYTPGWHNEFASYEDAIIAHGGDTPASIAQEIQWEREQWLKELALLGDLAAAGIAVPVAPARPSDWDLFGPF